MITVGVDTWVTVDQADTYFTNRPGSETWFALPSEPLSPGGPSKEGYLVTAFYWLSDIYDIPASASAGGVQRAQCEAALFLINYSTDYDKRQALIASGVESFDWSDWSETLGEVTAPKRISDILESVGYFTGSGVVQLLGDNYQR